MKKYIILIITICIGIQAESQNINGKVLERISLDKFNPIIGANVYWENTNIGTVTDKNGLYSIQEAPSLPATLLVSFIGYEVSNMELIDEQYIFYLAPNLELEEVNINSRQKSSKFSTIGTLNVETLNTEEFEKAACCNLSESFETNATVDVVYNDGVSGAKKIRMLGLDGIYTQITQENFPLIRGLSSSYGLAFTPGPFVESIQIIKGVGSVINGFESFSGQINIEYFKPDCDESLYYNLYGNLEGKIENNLRLVKKNGKWKSNLFAHFSLQENDIDNNDDGFLDMPHITNFNFLNRWKYENENIGLQFYARGFIEERIGGTIDNNSNPYLVEINNKLIELSSKTGIRMPLKPGKSIGLQTSFRVHDFEAAFGANKYSGLQKSAYLNLINQTFIKEEKNILKFGLSFYTDEYDQDITKYNLANADTGIIPLWYSQEIYSENRTDIMPGAFAEYFHRWGELLSITSGFRADYYNKTDEIYAIPRVNIKYNPNESTAIRISGGRALRNSNFISDNISLLASNREISFSENMLPEIAWNYGLNLTHCFYLFDREGTFNIDFYRTDFENQIVVDIEDQGILTFTNLSDIPNHISFSNAFQIDLAYELFKGFDVKLAYKINNSKTSYLGGLSLDYSSLLETPLLPKNRALINLAYSNKTADWLFDATLNYIGKSRIPSHELIDAEYSDPFSLINCQITKKVNNFDFYIGVENLLSYSQENPILDSYNPSSDKFDASLIWAPVMGRNVYFGLRYKLSN
ncbi:TonB-dependent receptor [Flavobacteriales bacterium]|nr:TonB-dependent receptor [Flavobacteriales bacterium]